MKIVQLAYKGDCRDKVFYMRLHPRQHTKAKLYRACVSEMGAPSFTRSGQKKLMLNIIHHEQSTKSIKKSECRVTETAIGTMEIITIG